MVWLKKLKEKYKEWRMKRAIEKKRRELAKKDPYIYK